MPAGVTPIEMPTERGGATARDRPEHGSLLHAQPGMLLEEGVTLRVEDIGHLHRRPAHGGGGLPEQPGPNAGPSRAGTCNCSSAAPLMHPRPPCRNRFG